MIGNNSRSTGRREGRREGGRAYIQRGQCFGHACGRMNTS